MNPPGPGSITDPTCTCVWPGTAYDWGEIDPKCPHHGGSTNVVELDGRRFGLRPARCSCGSEWFTLHGRPSDPEHGAVTLSSAGAVTGGTAGSPRCAECGTPWALRVT